jgi:prephenate dehydrogenase
METIAILGTGLMGSSLGLALKKRGVPVRIHAYARRAETREAALKLGVADAVFSDPAEAVRGAGLVVLCVPVLTIPELAKACLPGLSPGAVVTDVGSTKAKLVDLMDALFAESNAWFVGSHPIAGSEKTGIDAGTPDLYKNRLVLVCASPTCPPAANQRVRDLWKSVGATVSDIGPDAHDSILAATSHMPHMIAAVLARTVSEEKLEGISEFCGTGFRDTTRVASGSPEMWADIIDTNRESLKEQLYLFQQELSKLVGILDSADKGMVKQWLEEGARARDQILKLNRCLRS